MAKVGDTLVFQGTVLHHTKGLSSPYQTFTHFYRIVKSDGDRFTLRRLRQKRIISREFHDMAGGHQEYVTVPEPTLMPAWTALSVNKRTLRTDHDAQLQKYDPTKRYTELYAIMPRTRRMRQ